MKTENTMEKKKGGVHMTQGIPELAVLERLTDFEEIKEKIGCRLVNAAHNAEVLSDRPHTMVDDLAVTYHIELGEHEGSHLSTAVTYRLMETYGIDTKKLHEIALENMDSLSPATFQGMSETMAELMMPDMMDNGMSEEEARRAVKTMLPPGQEETMYVLSNRNRLHGAAALLNVGMMDDITGKIGKEYFILPSSIHEVLIVPKTDQMDLESLENMVREVNTTQVLPKERLSDHVYVYDTETHEVLRADCQEKRYNKSALHAERCSS